jgi:hypothetical protein
MTYYSNMALSEGLRPLTTQKQKESRKRAEGEWGGVASPRDAETEQKERGRDVVCVGVWRCGAHEVECGLGLVLTITGK